MGRSQVPSYFQPSFAEMEEIASNLKIG
jgi:hypothetical protein